MIPIKKNLEEVHINLWRTNDLPLLSKNIYIAILIYKKSRKL